MKKAGARLGWVDICLMLANAFSISMAVAEAPEAPATDVNVQLGVRIPLRDGVELSALLYTPRDRTAAPACIFTLTPYIADSYHDRGVYFASHGFTFLSVDVRGRGDSGGQFRPLIQEAKDGYDVVEWLAAQPYCNGRVAMWGGSYAGYDQWATAKERPPHLATILPMASAYPGVDFPYRNNISSPYLMQWLSFTGGHSRRTNLFADADFWASLWKQRFERGESFDTLERIFGGDQPTLREWTAHPEVDAYFDAFVATVAQLEAIDIPIMSVTGIYDTQQPGELAWFDAHMRWASPAAKARHFLIIGPWDHAGTRTPAAEVGGLQFGPASMIDRPELDLEWYRWVLRGGAKPGFLAKTVAYYVTGEETWRYADSLEAVTARTDAYYLSSATNANHVWMSGVLQSAPQRSAADHYVYDPRDRSIADLDARKNPNYLTDQRMILAMDGKELIYHTAAFQAPLEISGFFKLTAFIAINQPDTDFQVLVYEIDPDGMSILLSSDQMRARYRESQRRAELVATTHAQRYEFDHFTFVSRRLPAGSRLRLVIGPINSIYSEKNYNSDKPVSQQTLADTRPVTVKVLHDQAHPSALYVPVGQPE